MKARYTSMGLVFWILMIGFLPSVKGEIGLPFGPGETWTICQGYNGEISHAEKPMLDLSVNRAAPGPSGCSNGPHSSTGRVVVSPWKGVISPFGRTDMICITEEGGAKSMAIGHLVPDSKRGVGKTIVVGDSLGVVDGPNTRPPGKDGNGNYAHIHLQLYDGGKCLGNLTPFTGDMRFQYHPDLLYDKSPNQHSGVKLSNPAASTWHPSGTLIRAVDDYKVYFLQGGKRQWVYDETTFNAAKFLWEDVIVVSPQERDCYEEGLTMYPQTFSFPSWNNYQFGTLVRQTGTDPVYVVGEDTMLHHLNITEAQFISFGYNASMIRDVSSVGNIGSSLTANSFQQCQKNLKPPPPPPTPTCTYSLSPSTRQYFKGVGGEGTIQVTTQTGCAWNIQYRPSWFEPTIFRSRTSKS